MRDVIIINLLDGQTLRGHGYLRCFIGPLTNGHSMSIGRCHLPGEPGLFLVGRGISSFRVTSTRSNDAGLVLRICDGNL